MARALRDVHFEVTVATTNDDGPGKRLDVPTERDLQFEDTGAKCIFFQKQTELYKYSRPLGRWLHAHAGEFDVLHIHALFSYSSFAGSRAARRAKRPYIIRPLGVLNRWGMTHRRPLLKSISARLIEAPILRSAAAIHFTTEAEQREAAAAHPLISKRPAFVIPLPVSPMSAPPQQALEDFRKRLGLSSDTPVVLFLSRLDRKKGLELLLSAFALTIQRRPEVALVIAGSGDAEYTQSLHAHAQRLGVLRNVVWTGMLKGADKIAAFHTAAAFVLASHSENFGIAAAEAMTAGLPVILTPGVALSTDVDRAGAGIVVPADENRLAEAIMLVLSDSTEHARLAAAARAFAKETFSPTVVAQHLKHQYERIVGTRGN